ncbi:MAG TPA: hypothetical protein VE604_14095 [Candidatus Polarisedimenticolia bacterium]|nr:hypothetical protein [Candidatus Polarisedimenticolia bacterium]
MKPATELQGKWRKVPHPYSGADDHPIKRKPRLLGTPVESAPSLTGFGMTTKY